MGIKMIVYVKERYKADITANVITSVLDYLNLSSDFEIRYVKGYGRNIIVETDTERFYVIVSRDVGDGRNAFLAQYIPTVLTQFISDTTEKTKKICIYLLSTDNDAKTNFIIDTYRVAKTLGISLLNEDRLNIDPITPYYSFQEWKNAKTARQHYNSANNSSFAIEEEKGYTLYGKLYGANGKESTFIACQLSCIARNEHKKLKFVQIKEHGTERISSSDEKLLNYFGVSIANNKFILKNKQTNLVSTCRKQDEFKYNLLVKYGRKKCYLCDCDIESNVIASHIHRICDIDCSDLSYAEKRMQAVDGDNGFWLCANHDKMFENGVLTFDANGLLLINPTLKSNQKSFIKHITDVYKIKDEDFNNNLLKYLRKHNDRVKLGQ